MAAIAAIGAGVSLIGGAVSANQADKAGKRAGRAASRAQREIDRIKAERVPITNPYAGNSNLSSLASNLSDMISNPFNNMSVATQASEIQMEQADMALANSLDTLATTGASAGGATALAQAALASKKGVSASIEQQEVANEKMRAGGEERLQAAQTREQVRVQNVNIQEGRRMQTADAQGRTFKFNAQERRDVSKMNYLRGNYKAAKAGEYNMSMQKANAIGDIASSVGGLVDSAAAGGMLGNVGKFANKFQSPSSGGGGGNPINININGTPAPASTP